MSVAFYQQTPKSSLTAFLPFPSYHNICWILLTNSFFFFFLPSAAIPTNEPPSNFTTPNVFIEPNNSYTTYNGLQFICPFAVHANGSVYMNETEAILGGYECMPLYGRSIPDGETFVLAYVPMWPERGGWAWASCRGALGVSETRTQEGGRFISHLRRPVSSFFRQGGLDHWVNLTPADW